MKEDNNRLVCIIGLILLFSCLCNSIYAQGLNSKSDRFPPKWINNPPEIISNDFDFVSVSIINSSPSLNRAVALDMLSANLPRTWSVSSRIKMDDSGYSEYSLQGVDSSKHVQEFTMQVICDGQPVDIRCELVDSYWKEITVGNVVQYEHSHLYQVAKPHYQGQFCNWLKTTQYYLKDIWPSFLVPGAGQMVKGDWLKGGLFMGGTVALAGGALFTHLQSNIYNRKVYEAGGKEEAMRIYANRTRNFGTARNVCIGGLAALYVYNVIDAFVAPGAKRVEVIPNGVAVNF